MATVPGSAITAFLSERGLYFPRSLESVYASAEADGLAAYIYWPAGQVDEVNSLRWALQLLEGGATAPPDNYLPLMPVDEMSIACVVCSPKEIADESPMVVRWHLGDIDPQHQAGLLDTDLRKYSRSVSDELRSRDRGLESIGIVARRYKVEFVEKGIRPRGNVQRPVQLACQNVIVGLATMRHDASFDGLRVQTYLSCEVPHVATHEANRAMAGLLCCDAFQNGGTMEIRFGPKSREETVPPALQRFGRARGIDLGQDDPCSISPREARELFLAVTPMADELRVRSDDLVDRGVVSPERLCFTVMSSILTPIELDYVLATSELVGSILRGGGSAELRRQRLAELEACRAAVMLGMLQRHLDNADGTGTGHIRVFEDLSPHVTWSVDSELGAVALGGVRARDLPWSRDGAAHACDKVSMTCVPRGLPTRDDVSLVNSLQAEFPNSIVALLVPADMAELVEAGVPVMVCPDRLAEIDATVERKLGMLRVGRL